MTNTLRRLRKCAARELEPRTSHIARRWRSVGTALLVVMVTIMQSAAPVCATQGAVTNYIKVTLPLGVEVEIPKNWWLLGDDLNTTLLAAAEAGMKLANLPMPDGETTNLLRANSMPRSTYASIAINASDAPLPEDDLGQFSAEDLAKAMPELESGMRSVLASQNLTLLSFDPVQRVTIAGHSACVFSYRRSGTQGPVLVRQMRCVVGKKQLSFNLSYRESEAQIWKPVLSYIESSIRIPMAESANDRVFAPQAVDLAVVLCAKPRVQERDITDSFGIIGRRISADVLTNDRSQQVEVIPARGCPRRDDTRESSIERLNRYAAEGGIVGPEIAWSDTEFGPRTILRGRRTEVVAGVPTQRAIEVRTYACESAVLWLVASGSPGAFPSARDSAFLDSVARRTDTLALARVGLTYTDMVQHRDSANRFVAWYPRTWARVDSSFEQTRLKVISNGGMGLSDFNVVVVADPVFKGMTPESVVQMAQEHKDDLLAQRKKEYPDARLVAVGTTQLANVPAYYIIFDGTFRSPGMERSLRILQVSTVVNGRAYYLTSRASPQEFDAQRPIFDMIMWGFRFLDR